jgi:hypothetical protein
MDSLDLEFDYNHYILTISVLTSSFVRILVVVDMAVGGCPFGSTSSDPMIRSRIPTRRQSNLRLTSRGRSQVGRGQI